MLAGTHGQVEFILMGGTFMSLPTDYRDWFVRGLHDALSGHSSNSVAEAVRYSQHGRTKCIGLTIETRPDYCLTPHLTQVPGVAGLLSCPSVNSQQCSRSKCAGLVYVWWMLH